MKKLLICLLCLSVLGCASIKPNTMTDEELKDVVDSDCRYAPIGGAVIIGFFFGLLPAIPLYFIARHECPKDKELAIKELEIRKLDLIKKEEALKREKLEAEIITKPQALEPKKEVIESMVRNVEEKLSTPVLDKKVITVTWTSANIRSGADNNYPLVTNVKQGDKLTVIGENKEWFNVRLEDGREGWISNRVVK
jgi:hypothetical protein